MELWYTARGAGLAALILLSLTTVLGTLAARDGLTARTGNPAVRYVMQYVHRACAGLGLTVLALHIGTILADSYANVGLRGALIPFASGYRPTPVALGTLAVYTLLLAAVFGLARGRLANSPRGARVWRRVHALAYLGWGVAIWHGFFSGTDSGLGWVRLLYVICLAGVLGAVATRLVQFRKPHPRDRFAPLIGASR